MISRTAIARQVAGLAIVLAFGAAQSSLPTSVEPVPRDDAVWKRRIAEIEALPHRQEAELVFLGASIIQGWESAPDLWKAYYDRRRPLNLGIAGDRTQHVLWRLDHGAVDDLRPKLVILNIGGNNSSGDDNTGVEIGIGIQAVVKKLREKLPDAKVLLLAVFPRGEKPSPQREKIALANRIAAEMADREHVFYLDLSEKFLDPDGSVLREYMPDFVHPNHKGYEIWAEAMEPTLVKLLGES